MRIFLIVLLVLLVGAGAYLYYDDGVRKQIIEYVDKTTYGIHRESGMPDDPNRPHMRRLHLRKVKDTVPVGEMPVIRIKKEGFEENRPSVEEDIAKDRKNGELTASVVGTIYREKDKKPAVSAADKNTVAVSGNTGNETGPYIAILSGTAKIPAGDPDRLLIDGKIIRLYGVSLIKYAKAEQELKIVAEGREVSCGVISYSSNKIPSAVCFVKNNNAVDINLNYHLIENGFAVYKRN